MSAELESLDEVWKHTRVVHAADGCMIFVDDRHEWRERTDGRRRWLERVLNQETEHVERVYLDEVDEIRPAPKPRLR